MAVDLTQCDRLVRAALEAVPDADLLAPGVPEMGEVIPWLYSEEGKQIDSLVRWACMEIVESDDPVTALERGVAELQAMIEAVSGLPGKYEE